MNTKSRLFSAPIAMLVFCALLVAPVGHARAEVTVDSLQAQITQLVSQINALKAELARVQSITVKPAVLGDSTAVVCTRLTKNLFRKMTETPEAKAEIAMLQAFLNTQDLGGNLTSGTFDVQTENAVKKFQAANGIVSRGTPATTGYGVVGQLTRAKITEISCPTTLPTAIPSVITSGIYGDMDNSGNLSSRDVVLLLRFIQVVNQVPTVATESQLHAADLNQDGLINVIDTDLLKIAVASSQGLSQSAFPLKYGDANGDGAVTTADVQMISNFVQGKALVVDARTRIASDVNRDQKITAVDVDLVKDFVLQKISALPAVWGDVTGDYVTDIQDYAWLNEYLRGKKTFSDRQKYLADVYRDNTVNNTDLETLSSFVATGSTVTLPTGPNAPVTLPNIAPVISSFSGTRILSTGVTGTWTLSATDPNGHQVKFTVDWGDGATTNSTPNTNTATHSYATAGYYTIKATVRTQDGGIATSQTATEVVAGESAPVPTGSLSVAVSGVNPANQMVVAGGSTTKNGVFTFTAVNSAFTVQELKIKTPLVNNIPLVSDITIKYKEATGAVVTQTQALAINTNEGVATFTGLTMYVPKDGSEDLEVWVRPVSSADLTSNGGVSTVVLDFDTGFKAQPTSGPFVTTFGNADVSSNTNGKGTVFVVKSKPIITPLANSGSPASSKPIYKFNVTADLAGNIEIKKFTFDVVASGIDITNLYLKNETTGANVASGLAISSGKVIAFSGGSDTSASVETIGAGQTVTYGLYGQVAGWTTGTDALSVGLTEDSGQVMTPNRFGSVSGVNNTGANFIWSDRRILPHSLTSEDWTNGYLVEDMPATTWW